MDLDARPMGSGHDGVGALRAQLTGAIANEQRQMRMRLAVEQFADELRAQKPRGAGHQDEFFAIHSKKPVRGW